MHYAVFLERNLLCYNRRVENLTLHDLDYSNDVLTKDIMMY